MDIFRRELARKCLRVTKKVKKLKRKRDDVRVALDEMWKCLGLGDFEGVYRLQKFLIEVKKREILSRNANKPVEDDKENLPAVDGFRVDMGNGYAVTLEHPIDGAPSATLSNRECVEIPMSRLEWDALVDSIPTISNIFDLIS